MNPISDRRKEVLKIVTKLNLERGPILLKDISKLIDIPLSTLWFDLQYLVNSNLLERVDGTRWYSSIPINTEKKKKEFLVMIEDIEKKIKAVLVELHAEPSLCFAIQDVLDVAKKEH